MSREETDRNEKRKNDDDSGRKWELKKEEYSQFIGKDLVQTYIYLRNYLPKDAKEKFEIRQNLVEIGKELLPNIDEIQDLDDKKNIQELYDKAIEVVENQPSAGNRIYDFMTTGGKRFTCYQFTADEIKGKWTCLDTEYNSSSENFDKEQCKKLIPELITVDNKIFRFLIKYNVLKKEDKSPDELAEDFIKIKFKEKLKLIEQIKQKLNKKDKLIKDAE